MTAPATQAASSGTWHGERDRLITAAQIILRNCGVRMSHAKVCKLARRFQTSPLSGGFAFFEYVAIEAHLDLEQRRRVLGRPEVYRAITYLDPTGERAVEHVLSERGY